MIEYLESVLYSFGAGLFAVTVATFDMYLLEKGLLNLNYKAGKFFTLVILAIPICLWLAPTLLSAAVLFFCVGFAYWLVFDASMGLYLGQGITYVGDKSRIDSKTRKYGDKMFLFKFVCWFMCTVVYEVIIYLL